MSNDEWVSLTKHINNICPFYVFRNGINELFLSMNEFISVLITKKKNKSWYSRVDILQNAIHVCYHNYISWLSRKGQLTKYFFRKENSGPVNLSCSSKSWDYHTCRVMIPEWMHSPLFFFLINKMGPRRFWLIDLNFSKSLLLIASPINIPQILHHAS